MAILNVDTNPDGFGDQDWKEYSEPYKDICEKFVQLIENDENITGYFDDECMNVAGTYTGREGRSHDYDYDGSLLIINDTIKMTSNNPEEVYKKLKKIASHSK